MQNPTTSLADDVVATKLTLSRQSGAVIRVERAGATVKEVPGSHAVYVSNPQAVADVIRTAAKRIESAGQ